MKRLWHHIALGVSLLTLSALFYFAHYLLFDDAHHIFIYLVGDIAFVFIEVLLVTLIIHRVLEERAKSARLEKLNMVIGAFFSEVGLKLLKIAAQSDPGIGKLQVALDRQEESAGRRFLQVSKFLRKHDYRIKTGTLDWDRLKAFLMTKRDFLLRLIENPNLLEHESFTELLMAAFHLTEELDARETFRALPDEDQKHLCGDLKRVYGNSALQWLDYVEHLRSNYPYLFSLSTRTNPFDQNATAVLHDS